MSGCENKKSAFVGIVWLAVFAGLWGAIERLGMGAAESYHFAQIVVMRYAVHLFVLFSVCFALRIKNVVRTEKPIVQIGRGVCMFVMPASFMLGEPGQIGANLWTAFWLMPFFILIMVSWRDRVGIGSWLAVIVAFLGALLVLRPNLSAFTFSTFIPAIGGVSFAAYVLLTRNLIGESFATSLFYTAIFPLIAMAPMAIAVWQPIEIQAFWKIVGIGIFGLILLYSLDRTMGNFPPVFVAPLLFGAVVSEPLIEFLRAGGMPDLSQVAGSAILLTVGMIVVLEKYAADNRNG